MPTFDFFGQRRDERIAVHRQTHLEQRLHGLLCFLEKDFVVFKIINFYGVEDVMHRNLRRRQRFAKQNILITIGADSGIKRMVKQRLPTDHEVAGAETLVGMRPAVFNGKLGQTVFFISIAKIVAKISWKFA